MTFSHLFLRVDSHNLTSDTVVVAEGMTQMIPGITGMMNPSDRSIDFADHDVSDVWVSDFACRSVIAWCQCGIQENS